MVFFLALVGTLCWGLAPIFGKLGLQNVNPVTALALRTLIASLVVILWLVEVRGFDQVAATSPRSMFFIAIEAVLATLVGDLAYFAALKLGNINDVTVIMSTSPMVTVVLGHFALGEPIQHYQIAGVLAIVAGLVLIGIQPRF